MTTSLMTTAGVLLAAYLLGSVSGSLLLGRLRGVDIREHGSGNAGGTNALRTLGWRFALGVVVIDVGKGALAAWLALRWAPAWATVAVALAVAGHVWPLWHGLRGGKGAATLVGGLLVLWPQVIAPMLGVWGVVLVLTGYVGLATVLAAASVPVWAVWQGVDSARMGLALVMALFLAFTHRSNLWRLRQGCESRFERARLFHRALGRR